MTWNVADLKLFEGRLSRTCEQPYQVPTGAGESVSARLHRVINVDSDPALLDLWASGELHQVDDPATGETVTLTMPVVCHDPSRRLFALLIPPELRWLEYRFRADLLEELGRETSDVPAYVQNFRVAYDIQQLREIESGVLEGKQLEEAKVDIEAQNELNRQREAIAKEREEIRVDREQLDSVRKRFDKERSQLDQMQDQVQAERVELDRLKAEIAEERRQLQAAQLNAEGRELAQAQTGDSQTEESTQVVTEDQIIVVDESELEDSFAEDSIVEEVSPQDAFSGIDIEPSERAPQKLRDLLSGDRNRAVKIVRSRVMGIAQLPEREIAKLTDGEPHFFIQLHQVDGFPLIVLLLAQIDEDGQTTSKFAWPLDPSDDADRVILDRLRREAVLTLAFYDPKGVRSGALDIRTPLASNVDWLRKRADELLSQTPRRPAKALETIIKDDFEHLGKMQHPFSPSSFTKLDAPSEVKLAAGIVGYWSTDEQFAYLIGNRSFPLHQFRTIQEGVARAATEAGIFINGPLRKVARDLRIAKSDEALLELLIANFAETSISIRQNDLEPADQWDNWENLLALGDQIGVAADPDVVELAEVSLKRAQEAEELVERFENEATTIEDPRARLDHGDLVVSKHSESTGVTYFLPHDAVLDTFDDLASMPREDLELLLNDSNGRLEAAQMLIERFGGTVTPKVLEKCEEMTEGEVAALASFLETKAGALEGELVRAVESSGPSGVYVAASALAKVRSTSAIPALLDAYGDPKRVTDPERLALAIASFGDKLLPSLKRAVKRDGPNEKLVTLLAHLEDEAEGTLQDLSRDRSKNLREAAKLARQQRQSKTA